MLSTGKRSHFPNVVQLGTEYTNSFAGHPRPARCTISNRAERVFEPSLSLEKHYSKIPEPGHYLPDTSFRQKKAKYVPKFHSPAAQHTIGSKCAEPHDLTRQANPKLCADRPQTCAGAVTTSENARKWTMKTSESRTAKDGALRGVSTAANNAIPNPLGPGQYDGIKYETFRRTGSAPAYTFGNETERPEDVRLRCSRRATVPPGTYEPKSPFDMKSLRMASSGKEDPLDIAEMPDSSKPKKHKIPAADPAWGHLFGLPKRTQVAPDFKIHFN